jgi:anaerobic selenocysteine-containing dehydrogenase
MPPAIGMETRPLGPAKWNNVSVQDFYTAALEGSPYKARALVDFGSNLLLAYADPVRGRQALAALDFHVHLDLFMNPTAEMADIVLPVASAFEREGLKIGFDISTDAQTMVQLRPAVVPPQGQARPDTDIIFDLAVRLGLGDAFWGGDVDAAYRHQPIPRACACHWPRNTPSTRCPMPKAIRAGFRRPLAGSSSGRRPFAPPDCRRCRTMWNRRLAPPHGRTSPRVSRLC